MTEQLKNKLIKKTLGRVVKRTEMPDITKKFSPKQLAEAITAKRTSMKLTLVDVANALSISKPTLVKIEKGDMTVKLVTLLTVMEYLGLSFRLISDDFDLTNKATGESDVQWY